MLMPSGWEWVVIAVVLLMLVPAVAIITIVLARTKRAPASLPPLHQQLALPEQLQQADQMLAAGRIDPAEHAAMRNRILGLTD